MYCDACGQPACTEFGPVLIHDDMPPELADTPLHDQCAEILTSALSSITP